MFAQRLRTLDLARWQVSRWFAQDLVSAAVTLMMWEGIYVSDAEVKMTPSTSLDCALSRKKVPLFDKHYYHLLQKVLLASVI